MQKHRPYIALSVLVSLLLVLRFSGFNLGQDPQSTAVAAPDDIAAWGGAVFILEDKILTKLDAQLKVVKSVPLPLSPSPAPVPPKPVPEVTRVMPSELVAVQQVPSPDMFGGGRICADGRRVCVLYEGVIYTFDHDLNFVLSGVREY